MSVKVSDLYNCAYLILNGVQIKNLEVIQNHNNASVYFIMSGPNAEQLDYEFKTGKATANITQLKLTMNHLKDIMFDKLRERKVYRNDKYNKRHNRKSIR